MTPISDEAVWRVCQKFGGCHKCPSDIKTDDGSVPCYQDTANIIQTVLSAVSENPTTGSEK